MHYNRYRQSAWSPLRLHMYSFFERTTEAQIQCLPHPMGLPLVIFLLLSTHLGEHFQDVVFGDRFGRMRFAVHWMSPFGTGLCRYLLSRSWTGYHLVEQIRHIG